MMVVVIGCPIPLITQGGKFKTNDDAQHEILKICIGCRDKQYYDLYSISMCL